MINIKNVTKKYDNGVKALDNVTIEVNRGDIFGVIGLSGAGKSSLIRCVNRLEEVSGGEIIVNGKNISRMSKSELMKTRKNMGMIFQSFNLFDRRTVFQNVAFPLEISGVDKLKIKKKVLDMISHVGLEDKAFSYPSELSGGQKQRVAIARALINNPDILLCDEPTSALDEKTSFDILDLLKRLQAELGLTILIITHDMSVVKKICNRVVVLERGRVIDSGSTVEVFSRNNKYVYDTIEKVPKKVLENQRLMWLVFNDTSSKRPVISNLVRKYNIDVNIILGNIEYVDSKAIGQLLIGVDKNQNIESIVTYLEEKNIVVEVIDY